MRTTASAGIFFVLFVLLVGAACGGSTGEAGQRTTTEAAAQVPGATQREPVPAIEGESLDGGRLTLAGFRGRPLLINVWSSW